MFTHENKHGEENYYSSRTTSGEEFILEMKVRFTQNRSYKTNHAFHHSIDSMDGIYALCDSHAYKVLRFSSTSRTKMYALTIMNAKIDLYFTKSTNYYGILLSTDDR